MVNLVVLKLVFIIINLFFSLVLMVLGIRELG